MIRNSADFNVRYALRALRRRLPLFLVCVLLVPVVAVIASLAQTKKYTATAQLLFRNPQFDQMLFGSAITPSETDPARQAATNLGLVSLPRVASLTARKLHLTQDQVLGAISQSSDGQSDLVDVQAVATSPAFASKLANTFASQYIAFRRGADRATIGSGEQPLRQQIDALPGQFRNGGLGQSLQSRLSELRVLASLQTGGAELAQPAQIPEGPSSPKPARNAALGLFFGVILGIALVVLAEMLDRRLRDANEIEQLFERPLLATVPESPALRTEEATPKSVPGPELEAFRMLWANLRYYTLSRDIHSVLITSADRDDGKSTVSWSLAIAAAKAGERILLIEADLRKPTFAKRFGLPGKSGLTDVLVGDAAFQDAVRPYRLTAGNEHPGAGAGPCMDVLFAGTRPPNPGDLLQLPRMSALLSDATERYDLVVVDTPPLTAVSDAIPLVPLVDGLIVVTRLGNTLRDHAHRLRRQLHHLDAPTLGIVVNSDEEDQRYGRYGAYGYGEEYEPPASTTSGRSNGTPAPVAAGRAGERPAGAGRGSRSGSNGAPRRGD